MHFSALQRYILRECYASGRGQIPRGTFNTFYRRRSLPQSMTDSITASIERLIERGLMVGYGRRTPQKWFIESVRLTPIGRRLAHQLLHQQQTLPLKT